MDVLALLRQRQSVIITAAREQQAAQASRDIGRQEQQQLQPSARPRTRVVGAPTPTDVEGAPPPTTTMVAERAPLEAMAEQPRPSEAAIRPSPRPPAVPIQSQKTTIDQARPLVAAPKPPVVPIQQPPIAQMTVLNAKGEGQPEPPPLPIVAAPPPEPASPSPAVPIKQTIAQKPVQKARRLTVTRKLDDTAAATAATTASNAVATGE